MPVKNEDAIAFVVLSNNRFFERVVDNFLPESENSNFVDKTVDEMLVRIQNILSPEYKAKLWSTDRPPLFHVQTMGYVAGATEYVPPCSLTRKDDSVGSGDHIWGVSIHPEYGGWFTFRLLIVLEGVTWPKGEKIAPLRFLSDEARDIIIYEYNTNPDLARWRDFNNGESELKKYDATQYAYFHERSVDKRRRILELLKEQRGSTSETLRNT